MTSRKNQHVNPLSDTTQTDLPRFAIVAPEVKANRRTIKIELCHAGEIDPVLQQIGGAFGLVPFKGALV